MASFVKDIPAIVDQKIPTFLDYKKRVKKFWNAIYHSHPKPSQVFDHDLLTFDERCSFDRTKQPLWFNRLTADFIDKNCLWFKFKESMCVGSDCSITTDKGYTLMISHDNVSDQLIII